jgi:hypothetical protein
VRFSLGQHQAAHALLRRVAEIAAGADVGGWTVRIAILLGDVELAESLAGPRELTSTYSRALLAESSGELETAAELFAEAAADWHDHALIEEAIALVDQGRVLVALGRRGEAAGVLQQVRPVLQRLELRPALDETDALLEQATALSA